MLKVSFRCDCKTDHAMYINSNFKISTFGESLRGNEQQIGVKPLIVQYWHQVFTETDKLAQKAIHRLHQRDL